MYEIMLDTAHLEDLQNGFSAWPVTGVTSNPSILKKEGRVDVYAHLSAIKELCGKNRSLHVQVVSEHTEEIVAEAQTILKKLGKDVYIKIPVSKEGLPAIKALCAQGVPVTATAVYTSMQGILAALAGVKYIAVYYNRIENNGGDPRQVIKDIRAFSTAVVVRPKSLQQALKMQARWSGAYTSGAHAATVGADVIESALGLPAIDGAVADFKRDFESVWGKGKTMSCL